MLEHPRRSGGTLRFAFCRTASGTPFVDA